MTGPIATRLVPQARLPRVMLVLRAVLEGAATIGDIAGRAGLSRRHAAYALNTAEAFGLVDQATRPRATARGVALDESSDGTETRRRVLAVILSGSPWGTMTEADVGVGRRAHVDRVVNLVRDRAPRLAPSTAHSRALTIVDWQTRAWTGVPSAGERAAPHRSPRRESAMAAGPAPVEHPESADPKSGSPPMGFPGSPVGPIEIPEDLARNIERDNPWWRREPGVVLPRVRRDFVALIRRRLDQALAPIIVVRGPRQVGKTTAQLQVISDLLADGISPGRILRVQCDQLPSMAKLQEPLLRIIDWYERHVLASTLNAAAHRGQRTYLFFDEVQNLSDWAVQLKHLVDTTTTQVVVTGSSALRIEQGRDSLAGRIHSIEVGTLTLHEIARIRFGEDIVTLVNGRATAENLASVATWKALREVGRSQAATRDRVFEAFSARGGYPLVHARHEVPWNEVAEQLNETVIKRVIQHDLRVGERGRKRDAALLEELFRLGCRYAGQAPTIDTFVREAQRTLRANVGSQRVRHYLDFLDRTLLLHLVRPLEIRLKRAAGAPKLCLADHGLRASWLQELVPMDAAGLSAAPHLSDIAGRIAESITGTYLLNAPGIAVSHFPARPTEPEIDFVITVGAHRIPVEVKYRRRIDPHMDTEGLRSFIERTHYNAPFGILVTQQECDSVDDPRIVALPLSSFLLLY